MLTQKQVLDRSFFDVRCWLIEIAATFDRHDRGETDTADDPRLDQLREAIALLGEPGVSTDRAERMLLLFSEDQWTDG